jgi:RHH-type rel operon transcriptional repressor/antitoxin RelB
MSTTTEPTISLTVRLALSMREELDSLAKSTGRHRNALAQEALRRFIDAQRWQIARIDEGIRAADAGDFATDEEMNELWAEFGLEPEPERATG